MGTDFVFIQVRNPRDALQLAKDSKIRSHVTRHQWKQVEERSNSTIERVLKRIKKQEDQDGQELVSENPVAPHRSHGTQPVPALDVAIARPLGGLRGDPFRSYPVTWRPLLPQIVDHYLMSMAVDIPELDQPGNRGLLRTDWFPLVMSEPSLFLVIALLSASNYASVLTAPTKMKMDLLGLRCEAVQAVNEALKLQPCGNVSDALVGAIAKMASYESMYGNLDNYAVHMRGLQRVIELRGGLSSLGLNGLLRRIVIWIDRNGAFLNGSTLYFPGETFAPGQPLPGPNPGNFIGAW